MIYQEYSPHPGLKSHIKCYWTLTISASVTPIAGQHFLTEGIELSFNLADPIEFVKHNAEAATVRQSYVCGPMTQPMLIRPTRRVELFGVCFRPGGAYPFFSYPVSELVNNSAEIYDLWGLNSMGIVDRLQGDCLTDKERIDLLDRHFLHRLDISQKKDSCITAALDVIEAHKGQVNIYRLAGLVGLSSRQFERHFKERVGMSPKQLCRSLRFKNVFKHLTVPTTDSCGSAAVACGYYDQAHMINDFKHFTGISPAAYFAMPRATERFFTGNF
jgi:AraC-like DNA-binding protein